MASPTAKNAPPMAQQGVTQGVGRTGQQGAGQMGLTSMLAPGVLPAPGPQAPVLPDGMDQVMLHRLFPDAASHEDAASMALAQGQQTMAEGAELVADQQVQYAPQPE